MASGAVRCGARALTIIMFRVKVRFTETRGSGRPARSGAQRVSDLEAAAAAAAAPLPIGPRYTWTTPHGTRVHLLEDCAYLQRSKVKTMETCLYCIRRYGQVTAFCEVANGIYGFRVDFGREIGCQSGKSQKGDRVGMERQGVHAHYIKSGDHTGGFGAYANFTYNEVLRVDPDWCGKIVQYALVEPQADPKALPLALFVMHWSLHDSAAAAPELLAMMPLRKAWHPWGEGAGRCTTRSLPLRCLGGGDGAQSVEKTHTSTD